ncbi:MAG TPA: aminotransferase class III-fold pyridoxal phosphate-dependent enzyme [Jatrophihabitantaceae bacterium]
MQPLVSETSDPLAVSPAPAFSPAGLRDLLAERWGIADVVLGELPSERDRNVRVDDRYVLKLSNPAEPADVIDMEVGALAHARRADPELGVPRTVPSRTGQSVEDVADGAGRTCRARLMTLLPGRALEGQPIDRAIAEQVGAVSARTSVALQGFFHPAGGRPIYWDIRRLPTLVAPDDEIARRVAPALEATAVLPSGLQHADVTLTNVLARDGQVVGVIDFGDMHHTAAVADLAVTLASVLRNTATEQPAGTWQLAEAVLTGYQRHRPLSPDEVDVLGELVLARMALTLAVSDLRAGQHADNTLYITQYDAATRRVLDELAALDPGELAGRLARRAGTSRVRSGASTAELRERRAALMGGPLAPLFYRQPLDIVRGEAQWLIARDGTRYLDAYNNVAVVGHAHPAVTQAVSRQLATLNTHSRYLHAGVLELAERLLATMPAELDTCLFTTSGTEANELAWRLAAAATGGTGAVIAEHAYHGSTKWMADLSSNEWPPGYRPSHVATFPAPRGADLDETTAAGRIAAAAEALGEPPALVLADLQFTSEGILDAPAGFVGGLVAGAHAAGALFLADEVQSGFGRSGPQLWRFALAGVTPDVVTLGKPMGAGYPVGAVITRREIADRLARDYEYFSTFAATPAAAAAGLAVLDVLHDNDLPEHAVRVGNYLRSRLAGLAATSSALGDVRGTGLIAGVDILALPGTDPRDILNALVDKEVLAGLAGPDGTVLKIRPPLIWTEADVDRLVERLAEVVG